MAILIPDGYTFDGELPAAGKLPPLKFRYRPALYLALAEFMHPKPNGTEAGKAGIKLLMDHLVSWDATANGQSVPITEDALNRLGFRLEKLIGVISSYTGDEQGRDEKNS